MTRPAPTAQMYVPLLKARSAEISALLAAAQPLAVMPIFELQQAKPPAPDKKTGKVPRGKSAATDASYFLDDIARLWNRPFYLDLSRVASAAQKPVWWQLLTSLITLNPLSNPLTPVLADSDPANVRQSTAQLAGLANRAAIRISLPCLNPDQLPALLASVATDLQLTPDRLDIILDWADRLGDRVPSTVLPHPPLDDVQAHTSSVIACLPTTHGRIITTGTVDTKKVEQTGDWDLARREWWLWLRLRSAGLEITYGDYALYLAGDPIPVGPRYGHLRYSSGDRLHIHRRPQPATTGGLGAAFRACCTHLVTQSHFLGRNFSDADRDLDDIASTVKAPYAQGGLWREVALRHHLAVVSSQLSNPPLPPPPGTP